MKIKLQYKRNVRQSDKSRANFLLYTDRQNRFPIE